MIAFVSNNGWVDSNSADGLRKTFIDEFSHIWVYNLRGNQRTAGELSRQEGGKVFGAGARTGVAVLVAAKCKHMEGPCNLRYHGVADYQTREEKLTAIETAALPTVHWQAVVSNESGDWLNQRTSAFSLLTAIAGSPESVFDSYSQAVLTSRDAWCYNFSAEVVRANMRRMSETFNVQSRGSRGDSSRLTSDSGAISWSSSLAPRALRGETHDYTESALRTSTYRPFCRQTLYFDPVFNHRHGRMRVYYPTANHANTGFYVVGMSSAVPFSTLMLADLPNFHVTGAGSAGQFFPRWSFEKATAGDQESLLAPTDDVDEWGYRRVDNITDGILALYRDTFGPQVTKDDVFYYVYGVLHSEQYRTTFAADLKRMLPRIPLAATPSDFEAFAEAGRKLADLHVNYESVEPYPLAEQTPFSTEPWETFRVEKMRWADKPTKKAIVYNRHVTLGDIPAEAHRYQLGSRSALEWLIDRYQVKTDKDSGIVNDPNDWCREHGDPRYIVDLIKRVTRVSVETMRIVDGLPSLPL